MTMGIHLPVGVLMKTLPTALSLVGNKGERLRVRALAALAMGNAIWKVCLYIAVKWRMFFEKKCYLAVFFRKLSLQLSFGGCFEYNSGCLYDSGFSPELNLFFEIAILIFQ